MGVRGLQSYLESHCPSACYSVNLGKLAEDFRKKSKRNGLIVIDGMSCLRKLYAKLVWIAGGQWKGYVEHIENFVKKLRAHNISFVFFFDGNTPERKRETWVNRRLENLKDVANYFNMIKNNKELEQGKTFFIPPGLAAFTPLILKELLDCEVYTCLDECDKEVAEYAKRHGAMGILGQDSDYTIYNTAPYYFSINHLNLETLDTIVYDRGALSKVLHLSVDQLPVLSCLIGNDVIPQDILTLFHKQFLKASDMNHRHHNRIPSEVLIPKVATFISNQPPLEQLLNQLPQLSKAVFREDSMAQVFDEGIRMYILDLTGPEKYHPIDPEQYKEADIVEKVRLRHMNSCLGRHLYTIMRGEPYESSTTLEDYSMNSSSSGLAFRLLRSRIYSILVKSAPEEITHVPEWVMYNGCTLKSAEMVEPEEIPGGSPSLEELWEESDEVKWKVFCDCIHPKLYKSKIKTFPENLIFPIALMFYMQCSQPRPILKEWEIGSMVASFLTPIRKDLNQIRAINLPRIDSRAVHLATFFVKGLVNLYFLLATCDFPLNRRYCAPWEFWDGKVFHHMYLKGKSGARVEDMLDKKENLYKLYIEIKDFLAEFTVVPPLPKKLSPTPSQSESPKRRAISPSTSDVTASPPQSPFHPPNTLNLTKNKPKSPNLSPTSQNTTTKPAKTLNPNNKTPKKSPAKTPKKTAQS